MNKKEREMIAFIGYVYATTHNKTIKDSAKTLIKKYWVHPKEDESS